jgi:excisionase family DNA binding protein
VIHFAWQISSNVLAIHCSWMQNVKRMSTEKPQAASGEKGDAHVHHRAARDVPLLGDVRCRRKRGTFLPEKKLYTPAEAAQMLQVPESWLRKKVAARLIPCTFLGKHLRFSDADITEIVQSGSRRPGGPTATVRQPRIKQRRHPSAVAYRPHPEIPGKPEREAP